MAVTDLTQRIRHNMISLRLSTHRWLGVNCFVGGFKGGGGAQNIIQYPGLDIRKPVAIALEDFTLQIQIQNPL